MTKQLSFIPIGYEKITHTQLYTHVHTHIYIDTQTIIILI